MIDDILTEKLRYFAEHGNIDMERCVELAQAAYEALVEQSQGGELPQLAAAMVRSCGADEDEAAYFRCAVDSLLQEKWGAKPKDSAVITASMDMAYQGIWSALRAEWDDVEEELDTFKKRIPVSKPTIADARAAQWAVESGKPKSSGCLVLLGFFGILPLGFYAGRLFFS